MSELPNGHNRSGALSWRTLLVLAAIFAVSIAYQCAIPTGTDVSWLIDVAGKVLAGKRLYVDIIESNPPMAIFLYMPAVLIERSMGIKAETAEIIITCATAIVSLLLCARIMATFATTRYIALFCIFGAFGLAFLPLLDFAQREHFALMFMLPMFVLMAARAEARVPPVGLVILIGIGAGLGMTIKPHFALALLAPAVYLAASARSLRPILKLEFWIAAAVVLAFGAVVVIAFPDYLSKIVPMEMDTYVHVRTSASDLFGSAPFLMTVGLILATLAIVRRSEQPRQTAIMLLAAVAFAAVYLEQGKGWRYHIYPALALACLVFLTEIAAWDGRQSALRSSAPLAKSLRLAARILLPFVLMPLLMLDMYVYTVSLPLAAEIRSIAPKPRILALSSDAGVGHPLVRIVNGTWVSSVSGQRISRAARLRRDLAGTDTATQARMDGWINWDRDRIADALQNGRPDVIVVDRATFDMADLATARPDIGAMLRSYAKADEINGVVLLVRQDLVAASAAEAPVAR